MCDQITCKLRFRHKQEWRLIAEGITIGGTILYYVVGACTVVTTLGIHTH